MYELTNPNILSHDFFRSKIVAYMVLRMNLFEFLHPRYLRLVKENA